jgi:hypothetical protein
VFKKAHELWQVTGAEVLVVVKVKRKNTHFKTFYGGSKDLVEEFETVGVARSNDSCELYKKFDREDISSDDEEKLVLGPLSYNVPNYMKSSLPSFATTDQDTEFPDPVPDEQDQHTGTCISSTPKEKTGKEKITSSPRVSASSVHSFTDPSQPSLDTSVKTATKDNPQGRQGKKSTSKKPETVPVLLNKNMPTLSKGKWVAVAYHKSFYLGQIIETAASTSMPDNMEKVKIKFVHEKCSRFVWPVRDEIEEVSPIYIFNTEVEMHIDKGRVLKYTCSNLADVRKEYCQFRKVHADIL